MRSNHQRLALRLGAPLLVALLASLNVGCGTPKANVSGTVTLDGKKLPAGMIAFVPAKGAAVSAEIKDGAYEATGVPVGETKVTVTTSYLKEQADQAQKGSQQQGQVNRHIPESRMSPEQRKHFEEQRKAAEDGAKRAKEMKEKYRAIPEKYTNPEASGLHLEVKVTGNSYDVPLTTK